MTRPFVNVTIPGDAAATLHFAAEHFVSACFNAIQDHDAFYVALSGGSTPKALYELLTEPPFSSEINWEKIHLFWSDERAVSPDDPESNYHMAMKAGFEKMPIPEEHLHRMKAEKEIEKGARAYEEEIRRVLGDQAFDLILLGMGEDGHTASLFPGTEALLARGRLVVPNYIPSKKAWRMTMTFECLNSARETLFYVIGKEKRKRVHEALTTPPHLPCQFVGTEEQRAQWLLDEEAWTSEN